MMRAEALPSWAQLAQNRYELLLRGFSDALNNALKTGFAGSESVRTQLQGDIYDLAQSWLESETSAMARDVRLMGLDGIVQTDRSVDTPESAIPILPEDLDAEVLAHLNQLAEDLETAIRLQIERDISAVMRALRQIALTGALRQRRGGATASRGRGEGDDDAGALAALRFDFLDRSGKRWSSTRHVGVLWRHALVLAWNEGALMRGAQIGLDAMRVQHPDQSFSYIGVLVSTVDEESEMAGEEVVLWSSIRDEAFHPNSVAWLEPVESVS